ncbi:MAG TPA: hypothetical protein VHS32_21025 [Streptosporangiaceae bacterium]|nr:hypothetical protein [Streptosporangiaceae bacterium]
MPSAPRERKPALAALAVLLVALGAVAAGYLVINAGHRVGAVEITQQVGQGQRIPASAIKEVEIASNSGINYVAWQYANRVAGIYAAVQIPAGTLLTSAMTSATNNLAAGKVQVGLSLKPGQAPANLLIGQSVEAFGVGTGSGCGAVAAGGGGGAGGTGGGNGGNGSGSGVPITTGVIASVVGSTASNGSTAAVTLAVPDADAGVLACYASAGDVAIALTPGSG